MSDETDHDWLAWSLRDARKKVAAWPEWKREAFRVLPEIGAPERRDGGAMAKVIKRGNKHERNQTARHTCATCDSVVEFDRRKDLRDNQLDGAYVECPVCGAYISTREVFRG